jgi:hypothetical protein
MKRHAETEFEVLQRVAEEYRRRGFDVILRPSGDELPHFLADLAPDAIAHSGDQHVVLEIKRGSSLDKATELVDLAKRIEQQQGWHFDLVVQPLADDPQVIEERFARAHDVLGVEDIGSTLKSAELVLANKDVSSALLVAWTALEGALRRLALVHDVELARPSSRYLLKSLVAQGLLTRTDYHTLDRILRVRNLAAHGRPAHVRDSKAVSTLLGLAKKYLKEAQRPPGGAAGAARP